MMIYLAFPIDYAKAGGHRELHAAPWQHPLYCPLCARVEGEEFGATLARNFEALDTADLFVGIFDGSPTFGVPVEAWRKASQDAMRVCLIHPGDYGLFVADMRARGAYLCNNLDQAVYWSHHAGERAERGIAPLV